MGLNLGRIAVFCSATAFLLLQLQFYTFNVLGLRHAKVSVREWSWDTIPVIDDLSSWVDCYPGRQCARLTVPLNYSEPTGRAAIIALIRIPSPLQSTPAYRGPVLFNPGGPGGSGVSFVNLVGDPLATVLGPQFDIVSFDPRGVGFSTPRATVFDTQAERALWGTPTDPIHINGSDDGIAYAYARSLLTSRLAQEHDDGYLVHINTPNTARDMLQIVHAHGQEKLQYWGYSYGSVLGATFAAMFPDKVERLVIDGVVDSENYYATLWSNNLRDTDKALQTFFDGCFEAGPDRCAFWAPSPTAISQNLTRLYDALRVAPVAAVTATSHSVITYPVLKSVVLVALYLPYFLFPRLADALAALAAGDGSLVQHLLPPPFECECGPSSEEIVNYEAAKAIGCTDGVPMRESVEELRAFYGKLGRESSFADVWTVRLLCAGWPANEENLFRGPFVANTSHPLLIIGNTADPVTPLWAAHKMSKGFPGSTVLTLDSPGHCSLAAVSPCTYQHVRAYFQNGTLPDAGTVCPATGELFPDAQGEDVGLVRQAALARIDLEERALVEAAEALSRARAIRPPGFTL